MLFTRYYFWIAPHVLLALVGFGLVERKWLRRFPFFFLYVAFELAQFLILFSLSLGGRGSLANYQSLLLSGLAVGVLLKFGVVAEVGGELFYPVYSVRPMLSAWLRAAGAALLLTASLASLVLFRADIPYVERVIRTLDFSVSMILSGLLVLLLFFARYLYLPLRSYSAGILLGFGIYATVGLASSAIRAEFPRSAEIAIGLSQMAAYHVAVVVWLAYLFARQPSLEPNDKAVRQLDLDFWNQELERMVGR